MRQFLRSITCGLLAGMLTGVLAAVAPPVSADPVADACNAAFGVLDPTHGAVSSGINRIHPGPPDMPRQVRDLVGLVLAGYGNPGPPNRGLRPLLHAVLDVAHPPSPC